MGASVGGTGKRLRELAEALYDGNKSELARAVDMKPGSFSKYIRGARQPGAAVLQRLTRLGVNLNWFVTGTGPMFLEDGEDADESTEVELDGRTTGPLPSTLTIAGTSFQRVPLVQPRENEDEGLQCDEIGEAEWLSHTFIRRQYEVEPGQLRGFQVSCTFMADTIRPGDRMRGALVDAAENRSVQTLVDGAPYLIYGPMGLFVKRIVHSDGDGLLLRADHSDVDDEPVSSDQWASDYRPIARILDVVRPV